MTPLELVNGSVVSKVVRTASARDDLAIDYLVTVRLPDGGEVRFSQDSRTSWRRVMKKAGLKLVSKEAKKAAADLRDRIASAVAAEMANPAGAMINSKVLFRAKVRRKRSEDRVNAEKRKTAMAKNLMRNHRMTKEEVLDLWNRSVLEDVIGS